MWKCTLNSPTDKIKAKCVEVPSYSPLHLESSPMRQCMHAVASPVFKHEGRVSPTAFRAHVADKAAQLFSCSNIVALNGLAGFLSVVRTNDQGSLLAYQALAGPVQP